MELSWSLVAALFLAVFFAEICMFGISVAVRAITQKRALKKYAAEVDGLMADFEKYLPQDKQS